MQNNAKKFLFHSQSETNLYKDILSLTFLLWLLNVAFKQLFFNIPYEYHAIF